MSNEVTALAKREINTNIWSTITSVAPVMKDSRLFGVATEAQAATIMAKGYELGLSLTASFEYIHVIDGKPSLSPRGALALILQSPLCDGVEIKHEKDAKGAPKSCTVTMKRKGGLAFASEFSMEDAERAQLIKDGSGWKKYPAQMMQWRAAGFAADVVFPDVIGGLKRADEYGADLSPDGDVIQGSWTPVTTPVPAPTPVVLARDPDPTTLLNDLLARYGAEAILTVNQGKIPATVDELRAVATALENGAAQ